MHRESVSWSRGGPETFDSNKPPYLDSTLFCVSVLLHLTPCPAAAWALRPSTQTSAPLGPSSSDSSNGPGVGFVPVTKPTGVQTQDRKGPLLPAAHFRGFWFQIKAHSFLPGSWDVSLCSPAGAPARIWHSWTLPSCG